MHVGEDDLDVGGGDYGILFGHAGDETVKTKVRNLMIELDVGVKTAILFEMKLGGVVTTLRASGFGVVSVEYENLSFTVWCVGVHWVTDGLIFAVMRDAVEARSWMPMMQRCGCARFCQHIHALHGNSPEKDIDCRAQG